MTAKTILLVEDDLDLLDLLRHAFEAAGFRTILAQNGKAALHYALRRVPDAVLLDLILPDMDGMEVCRALRRAPAVKHVPIVMLTSRGKVNEVILGLENGADDYLRKPLQPREVVARVQSLLRRSRGKAAALEPKRRTVGDLAIDPARFEVSLAGRKVALTPGEFRIVQLLAREPGRVFSRKEILEEALGSLATERNVDIHIYGIRRKLGGGRIEAVRGVGYRYNPPAS